MLGRGTGLVRVEATSVTRSVDMIKISPHHGIVGVVNIISEWGDLIVPNLLRRSIQISIYDAKGRIILMMSECYMLNASFKNNIMRNRVIFENFRSDNDKSATLIFVVRGIDIKFMARKKRINFCNEMVVGYTYVLETDDIVSGDERAQKRNNSRKPTSDPTWVPNTQWVDVIEDYRRKANFRTIRMSKVWVR